MFINSLFDDFSIFCIKFSKKKILYKEIIIIKKLKI